MTTIANTISLIQALNAPLVTSAPTVYPSSIHTAELPMALCRPGPGKNYTMDHGSTMLCEERTYIVEVYILPVSQGILVDQGMQQLIELLDAFNTVYRTGVALDDYAIILNDNGDIADSGSTVHLSYGGVSYHGIVFSLKVRDINTGQ